LRHGMRAANTLKMPSDQLRAPYHDAFLPSQPRRSLDPSVRALLPRWIAMCTMGELAGFALGGAIGYAVFTSIPDPTSLPLAAALLGGCALAGIVEGATLGAAQWWVLRKRYPTLRLASWAGVTALAAAICWALGGLPSTLISLFGAPSQGSSGPSDDPSWAAVMLVSMAGGALLGAFLGFVQSRVLRRHADGAGWWIAASSVGWALALPWSFLAGSSAAGASSFQSAIAISAAAGLLMGATISAALGWAMSRITPVIPRSAQMS
jgi:hypothetical protein